MELKDIIEDIENLKKEYNELTKRSQEILDKIHELTKELPERKCKNCIHSIYRHANNKEGSLCEWCEAYGVSSWRPTDGYISKLKQGMIENGS